MRSFFLLLVTATLLFANLCYAGSLSGAPTERKVALVVGAGEYASVARLKNPPNDARLIGDRLSKLGFDVRMVIDPTKAGLTSALRDFGKRVVGASVGLFYFSGHGIQVGGQNWLIPVDAAIKQERDVYYDAIDLDKISEEMSEARVSLVFLDACRDNPFIVASTRGISRQASGLAPSTLVNQGSVIAFAAAPGRVAYDGIDNTSPFTQALAAHIADPGVDVALMLRRVAKQVEIATDGRQTPWVNASLRDEFQLVPNSQSAPVSGPQDDSQYKKDKGTDGGFRIGSNNSITLTGTAGQQNATGNGAGSNAQAAVAGITTSEQVQASSVRLRGVLTLRGPVSMEVGSTGYIEVVLGDGILGTEQFDAADRVRATTPDANPYQEQTVPVQVNKHVIATLTGDGLNIGAPASWPQALVRGGTTVWKWPVRAVDSGMISVVLRIETASVAESHEPPQFVTLLSQNLRIAARTSTVNTAAFAGTKDADDGASSPRSITTSVLARLPASLEGALSSYGIALTGVAFLVIIFAIVFRIPNPTQFQYTTIRIILALAAAAVATLLTGFLEIRMQDWAKAGGALAVFLIVYFYNPATLDEAVRKIGSGHPKEDNSESGRKQM